MDSPEQAVLKTWAAVEAVEAMLRQRLPSRHQMVLYKMYLRTIRRWQAALDDLVSEAEAEPIHELRAYQADAIDRARDVCASEGVVSPDSTGTQ